MNYKKHFLDKLMAIMPKHDAEAEFYLALEILTGKNRLDLLRGGTLSQDEVDKLETAFEQRISTRTPLQYVLNAAYFYGKKFYVDKNVLIPRPETELLVDEVLRLAQVKQCAKILEIGTGSGCLAIMLKLLSPDLEITASDISEGALEVARKNAKSFGLENKINFVQSDIFENINGKFDIIFSNPPYIPLDQKALLEQEVSGHEPHNALFADDDGLYFYKKIICESHKHLSKNAALAFELGIYQGEQLKIILHSQNFIDIKMIYDLNKICRVMSAQI